MGGQHCWKRDYPGRAFNSRYCGGSPLFSCSFICYSWPLYHRKASKRVWKRFAYAAPVSLSGVSCSDTSKATFRSLTIGSWSQGPKDELLTS